MFLPFGCRTLQSGNSGPYDCETQTGPTIAGRQRSPGPDVRLGWRIKVSIQRSFADAVSTTHTDAMNERILRTASALARRAQTDLVVIELAIKFDVDGAFVPTSGFEHNVDEIILAFPGTVRFRRLPLVPDTHSGEQRTNAKNDAEIATTVLACSGRKGDSLMVVGAHSIADKVGAITGQLVALSDIPIVVVPANSVELSEDPFHLVVAIDETPNVGSIATRISELHIWFDVRLSLLHVLNSGGERINGASVLAHDRAAHQMQRCASRLPDFGVDDARIHTAVRTGPTPNVIIDQMRRGHATLGVLPVTCSARHHRRPNGVSSDVLIDSPVPILLFYTEGSHEQEEHVTHMTTIEAAGG